MLVREWRAVGGELLRAGRRVPFLPIRSRLEVLAKAVSTPLNALDALSRDYLQSMCRCSLMVREQKRQCRVRKILLDDFLVHIHSTPLTITFLPPPLLLPTAVITRGQ